MSEMWFDNSAKVIEEEALASASVRQLNLTKPPGSLGLLEDVAVKFSGFQSTDKPLIENIFIGIMAGDHGIATEGVSAFPQVVTSEMIKNFANGGAAISVLAREHDAVLQVYNLGTIVDLPELEGVNHRVIASQTASFLQEEAMTDKQLLDAMAVGKRSSRVSRTYACTCLCWRRDGDSKYKFCSLLGSQAP